jgi:hypothetical protein
MGNAPRILVSKSRLNSRICFAPSASLLLVRLLRRLRRRRPLPRVQLARHFQRRRCSAPCCLHKEQFQSAVARPHMPTKSQLQMASAVKSRCGNIIFFTCRVLKLLVQRLNTHICAKVGITVLKLVL